MTVRHGLPGNDTWERSVAACDDKESAEVLHAIGDFGDVDRKPNETEYEPQDNERRPHLNLVRLVSEDVKHSG